MINRFMSYQYPILRVNLSNREVSRERPQEEFFRTYFGGRGFIAYSLLKELEGGIDPLGPKNKLIFAAGPLTGAPLAGTGRSSVGAKSPLTGAYGDSEAGGYWGAELKKAGYSAIIIEGESPQPVFLNICDDEVQILDADKMWGKNTKEVQEILQDKMKDRQLRVAQIGPAGENGVYYANITHDLTHFAGRTGMGAVMGLKKLKAIAIRGRRRVPVHDEELGKKVSRELVQRIRKTPPLFSQLGTAGIVQVLNAAGGLPTRNFTKGTFSQAQGISGERMHETIFKKSETCFACPIRCKRVVEAQKPYRIDPVYGGPEYETIASLGSLLEIGDIHAVAKGNELCNSYGMDTISTGVSIAFAMECYEKGLLTKTDTGGMDLRFGNQEAMLALIEEIAFQKGLGRLLSLGVKRAAEEIGNGAASLAMHIKGQEIPMHEPRLKQGLGIGYMVSPTGADHCHNMHDTAFSSSVEEVKALGIIEPLALDDISPKKIRLLSYYTSWRYFMNCALICIFVPWNFGQVVEMVSGVTGWNTSLWELLKVGERAETLCRIFNLREGFTEEDDMLTDRWLKEEFTEGPLKGVKFTGEELQEARRNYYWMMGWDNKGVPTVGKVMELGIEWAREAFSLSG